MHYSKPCPSLDWTAWSNCILCIFRRKMKHCPAFSLSCLANSYRSGQLHTQILLQNFDKFKILIDRHSNYLLYNIPWWKCWIPVEKTVYHWSKHKTLQIVLSYFFLNSLAPLFTPIESWSWSSDFSAIFQVLSVIAIFYT